MKTSGTSSGQDVAIIGYAARLPGAASAQEAWETLMQGRCNVSEIPSDRWSADRFFDSDPAVPGKTYARRAGLLDNVYDFDNGYFGFTPREAEQLDPQQRLLLETVARAFDHAGLNPAGLDKDRTGVFVGASTSDHSTTGIQDLSLIDAQYMLGNTLSVISNRIAYQWDLRGPSYTVDTACSSGLFALDQARRAIESGELDTAIVGSVNMLLSPIPFVGFSKASMLSETGLCQAFGKNGDGYVRAEGAVVFVLRREDLARVSQNRIRSYVCATATNSDGRTPGIAMPSSDAQQILLEKIKEDFGIDPDDLAFVEAHGTGTAVGDPLEARAIGRAFGQTRKSPLPIGSAKTNFGHLEPASGLVGLLKAQLALENSMIPASLHSSELNPDIPFDSLGLEVVQQATPLPERKTPWLVGVNSFGFGGANAHAVLRQAISKPVHTDNDMPMALRVTAEDPAALRTLAEDWRARAQAGVETDVPGTLAAQVSNANQRLALHHHRLCVVAKSPKVLAQSLSSWLEDGSGKHASDGVAQVDGAQIAFVFSGNGSQWPGMGRQLFLSDPVFRESFEKTNEIFHELGSVSVVDMLMASDLPARLNRAPVAQPLLLAVQIALVDSLAGLGLRPHATLGHSAGELAAAYAAGAITREIAVRGIYARSQTMDQLFEKGGMAAIVCDVEQAQELIDKAGLAVDIAAENSVRSLTLAGEHEDLKHLIKIARKQRIVGKMLDIDYPYHSRYIDPLKDRMDEELQGLNGVKSPVALYSGCLGDLVPGDDLTPEYWWQNARGTVQFRQAMQAMARDGISIFLEISPKSVLLGYLRDNLEEAGSNAEVLGSLEENRAEEYDARRVAMKVLAHGGRMDEAPLLGPERPFVGNLPDYPFTRQPFKLQSGAALDIFGRSLQHVLLGGRISPDATVWTGDLSLGRLPWLADHKVCGKILLPAMAVLEIFTEAAAQLSGSDRLELRNLELLRAVTLKKGETVFSRVTYDEAARRLTLHTRTQGEWQLAAQTFCFENAATDALPVILPETQDPQNLYSALAEQGLDYGPAFARVGGLSPSVDGLSMTVHLTAGMGDLQGFRLDPAATDAALHGLAPLLAGYELPTSVVYVPGRMGKTRIYGTAPVVAAQLRLRSAQAAGICFDVSYFSVTGDTVATIEELRLRPIPSERTGQSLFWHEELVPAEPAGAGDMVKSLRALVQTGSETPSDLEVIRDTIGGRLAWDIVTAQTGEGLLDRRYDLAVASLQSMELAMPDEAGGVNLVGECPWPDIETLIDLLATGVPEASDELFATLNATVTDHGLKTTGTEMLRAASLAAIGGGDGLGARVLLTGVADPAVIDALTQTFCTLTVAVHDDAEAERLRLTLNQSETFLVTTLDGLSVGQRFDTVLGIGTAEVLSDSQQKALLRLGAKGADLLLIENEPDLFELMTSRYRDASVLDDLTNMLRPRVTSLHRQSWSKAINIQFITARYIAGLDVDVQAFSVVGDGQLSEDLRSAMPEGRLQGQLLVIPSCLDPVDAALQQSEHLRGLAPGKSLVWLVQEGLQHADILRGWRRVLANETGRDLRCLNVIEGTTAEEILRVISGTSEHELVIDDQGLRTPRIAPLRALKQPRHGEDRLVLAQQGQGRIETLEWSATPRITPASDEVEIKVAATGLNFRDVMWAQGLLPPELLEAGFAGPTLGMECAGRVTRAGVNTGFTAGQSVLAFSPSAFSSHVTVRSDTVMALPEGIDPVQAATIPVIFVTADYALNELAHVAEKEWVLIHGGAGGVGLAALQIARRAGARVIATAGSPEKRGLLKAMGAEEVFDSRSLHFVSDVQQATAGRGVDVVINSLAGEAMEQSLHCLAPFGRFVELGKRDFVGNTAVGLRALKDNISYFGVDADQLLSHRPEVAARVMNRVLKGFANEDYVIPPHRVFTGSMVDEAFRLMQKSGHIGKIVVAPPQPSADVVKIQEMDYSGAWLITGGTGGFGLATAEWLASQGASDLWLVSRGGRLPEGAAVRLEASGASVHLRSLDITNAAQIEKLMAEILFQANPLAGVVHAAAHFDDAVFDQTDREGLQSVLAAKLKGAHHLDQATRQIPLRHFWMYSSLAARFGNLGQSGYVAANMGLEALAKARKSEGLPALAVAWGPIGDTGYLDRSGELRDVIERKMGRTMTAPEALGAFGRMLEIDPSRATFTVAAVDWSRLTSDVPLLSEPLFEWLNLTATNNAIDGEIDLKAMIASMGEVKARRAVLDLLLTEASKIMRMAPSEIDTKRPLMDLGFDSLMGMNLKLAVEERIGTDLPVAAISDGVTFTRMAHDLVQAVQHGPAGEGADAQVTNAMAEKHLSGTDLPEEIRSKIVSAAGKS